MEGLKSSFQVHTFIGGFLNDSVGSVAVEGLKSGTIVLITKHRPLQSLFTPRSKITVRSHKRVPACNVLSCPVM